MEDRVYLGLWFQMVRVHAWVRMATTTDMVTGERLRAYILNYKHDANRAN